MALTRRRQPAKRFLVVHEISQREAAEFIGCRINHLRNALNGRSHPNESVRERLPILVGMPLEVLFDPEVLEDDYTGPRGRRAAKR